MKILCMIIILIYTGCSKTPKTSEISYNQFSCTQKAKPKSLQFLEQQYRCTSQE